jgi:thioesterase domain-containing protein
MFPEVDPVLGPEMRSTGEVLGMADSFGLAFFKAQDGSLATLATLAGWALATLLAEELVGPCRVAVFESELRYLRPVTGDFTACCTVPETAERAAFATTLRERGRARLALTAEVQQGDAVKVRFRGRYAVSKAG